MYTENTLPGLCHLEGALTEMGLVANQIDWDSETQSHKQHSLGLAVPGPRGLCPKGSQFKRGLNHVNICCLLVLEKKNPNPVAPTQCHKLGFIAGGDPHFCGTMETRNSFHYTILTPCKGKAFLLISWV